MSFSGTLDETNGMTMTRLIERLVHADTPGRLLLTDEASGRAAEIRLHDGAVDDVQYGTLFGDEALTAISQVMPWTFAFVPDDDAAVVAHPSMASRSPGVRVKARPAAPRAVQPELPIDPAPDAPDTPAAPELPSPEAPAAAPAESVRESDREWANAPAIGPCLRFASLDGALIGQVDADDHEYFRSDLAFLSSTAGRIAAAIDGGPAALMAIAEPDRATAYQIVPGGFLGLMAGAGAGIDAVLEFPEDTAAAESAAPVALPPDLAAVPGVIGALRQRGADVVRDLLPEGMDASQLAAALDAAIAAYASAERRIEELFLTFPGRCLLTLSDGSGARPLRLTFILADPRHAAAAAAAARGLLQPTA